MSPENGPTIFHKLGRVTALIGIVGSFLTACGWRDSSTTWVQRTDDNKYMIPMKTGQILELGAGLNDPNGDVFLYPNTAVLKPSSVAKDVALDPDNNGEFTCHDAFPQISQPVDGADHIYASPTSADALTISCYGQ